MQNIPENHESEEHWTGGSRRSLDLSLSCHNQ
jgi:hypothetical protein